MQSINMSGAGRFLTAVVLVCLAAAIAPGCGDDSDAGTGRAGSSGKDGGGGKSGLGGLGGSAGKPDGGPTNCGNNKRDDAEECDDGNMTDGDGCNADCTYTCIAGPEGNAECNDLLPCNGTETCSEDRKCLPGTPLLDGSLCGENAYCKAGKCELAPVNCGDGLVAASEECDDSNQTEGDGCFNCRWECVSTASGRACDSSTVCRGNGTCNDATHICKPGPPAFEGIECGTDMVCRVGNCVSRLCGNSKIDGVEECDDGNTIESDGCQSTCKFSCVSTDAARNCTLPEVCAGTSTCDDTTHKCSTPTPKPDNTACGTNRYCSGGVCTLAQCGNRKTEPGEDCDDANMVDTDGCKSNCKFSCTSGTECSDGKLCTADVCDATSHRCSNPGDNAQNGQPCTDGSVTGSCQNGVCTPAQCGDGKLDSGEECDRGGGNGPGSGCTNSCQFECDTDPDCSDGNSCTGIETCAAVSGGNGKKCNAGTPASVGAECLTNPRSICDASHACKPSICGDQFVDAGRSEDCDDGNTNDNDSCRNNCKWRCTGPADCGDGNTCTQDVCTNHTCSNPADTARNGQSCSTGTCDNGVCKPVTCGNSIVEAGEECDRGAGNGAGSGCVGCQFECDGNANCSDSNVCNGTETCQTVSGTGGGQKCQNGTAQPVGFVCQTAPQRALCNASNQCVVSTCGDSIVDSANGGGEECDKGAGNGPGSGCVACQFECDTDSNCLDINLCNGLETCQSVTGGKRCQAGTRASQGTPCGNPTPRSICNNSGACLQSICGDGFTDPGTAPAEECDRGAGNNGAGTGCGNSCQNECDTAPNCDDGNACDGAETCGSVAGGGMKCSEGTPPSTGTVCGTPTPRKICRNSACQTSSCGDTFVDSGAGEQCEPPNIPTCSGTCQTIVTCDLSGTWGVYLETNVTWPGTVVLVGGSGKVRTWVKATRTQSGTTISDAHVACGIEIPDFQSSVLFVVETYGTTFPASIFDNNTLPTTSITGSVSSIAVGATFTTPSAVGLIGLTLTPANAPWPSDDLSISPFDHDNDTKDGVTATVKTGGSYDNIPVNGFKSARADRVYVAVRQIAAFNGTVTTCTTINATAGAAIVSAQDSHVVGCRVSGGGDCDSGERDFVDDNRVIYSVASSTFRMQKLAAGANCAAVRAAFP